MKKTGIQKKLMLSKETLRSLSEGNWPGVVGGATLWGSPCFCETQECEPSVRATTCGTACC